jgi:flagellar biosynthesis protein FlhF
LKSLIFNLLSQTDQARSLGLQSRQIDTYSYLIDNGLDKKLASKILQKVLDKNSQQSDDCNKEPVMNLMQKVLPCRGEINLNGDGPKMVAFVGPTGVGKTTTIAKIAAEYALRRGQKVALVSLDTYRLGAVDQLRIYGEIMEVPFEVAGGKEDLRRIVASHSDKDLILIDTTGRSHQDKDYSGQLKEIFDAVGGVEIHLVLSVTAQEKLFNATYHQFSSIGVDRVLFTKLDEGLSFGSLFNFSVRNRLPISYFTSGQRVPEDLEVARPERVISLIFN